MNDKELLELAALALNLSCVWSEEHDAMHWPNLQSLGTWNPLAETRDGLAECLRMEIDLKLDASFDHGDQMWIISCNDKFLTEHQDRQRASTMAAAEIVKSMKKD